MFPVYVKNLAAMEQYLNVKVVEKLEIRIYIYMYFTACLSIDSNETWLFYRNQAWENFVIDVLA